MSYLPEFFSEKVLALEPLPVCTVRGKPGLCSVNGPDSTARLLDLMVVTRWIYYATGVRGCGSAGRVLV